VARKEVIHIGWCLYKYWELPPEEAEAWGHINLDFKGGADQRIKYAAEGAIPEKRHVDMRGTPAWLRCLAVSRG